MAFNPYETRPVGSEQYEQHIQDVYVSSYYYNQIPGSDENLENLAGYGEKIWKQDPDPVIEAPWENLIIAVTVQAAIDYANIYAKWKKAIADDRWDNEVLCHSRMLRIENEYFRRYDITEHAFDILLKMLENGEYKVGKHSATYIAQKIYKNYFAFKENERKKGKNDRKNAGEGCSR